jgi:uncharacterized cupin superfamily protein
MEHLKHIVRAADARGPHGTFSHPLNPNSEISGMALGAPTGLKRVAVNFARVPPGKESFIYHRHEGEEEWVYILEGHGQSEIDDVVEDVGPGDFIGYPQGVAHTLRNTGDVDLVYLMGGERLGMEIAEFPRHGQRLFRVGENAFIVDESALRPLRRS